MRRRWGVRTLTRTCVPVTARKFTLGKQMTKIGQMYILYLKEQRVELVFIFFLNLLQSIYCVFGCLVIRIFQPQLEQ